MNVVADALSRVQQESSVSTVYLVENSSSASIDIELLKDSAREDELYQLCLHDEDTQAQLGLVEDNSILKILTQQVYVPNNQILRFKLILEHHDNPISGHWDVKRTAQLVQQYFYWPSLNQDVIQVVETCDPCQRAQIARKKDQAPIRYIEAQYPWEIVTIDFVSGFASTKRKHTAVCVICDRFTRMVHMESCLDHATAKETAKIAIRQIIAKHGCPRVIISDRGTQFDSEFMETFMEFYGYSCSARKYTPSADKWLNRTNE